MFYKLLCNIRKTVNLIDMKLHRFFIDKKIEDKQELFISDLNIIHQIKNVLRLKVGDEIVLLDGLGVEFVGQIAKLEKTEIVVSKVSFKVLKNVSQVSVKLAPALLKKDKYEWVLQKCTELGVDSFTPIISERTEKTGFNFERAIKIVKEASEQSERVIIPDVSEPILLHNFLENNFVDKKIKIYALELGEVKIDLENICSEFSGQGIVPIILVGPEGGWGEKDLEIFEKFNVEKVSLGKQVLRAETASVAVSSLLCL
jgi:16S rRNA (uracil1498-N3)-methyltransferase